jgi:hypothetical protein
MGERREKYIEVTPLRKQGAGIGWDEKPWGGGVTQPLRGLPIRAGWVGIAIRTLSKVGGDCFVTTLLTMTELRKAMTTGYKRGTPLKALIISAFCLIITK